MTHGVNRVDLDIEQALNRRTNVVLGGGLLDAENNLSVFHETGCLLRHDWTDNDFVCVFHDFNVS